MTLSVVELPGPITTKGTNRIDRVARWYLQKTAHDLGGIYLFHDIGDVTGCDRYAVALQWSRESVTQAIAGGFPELPADNGTTNDIDKELKKLADGDCDVPDPMPMLPPPGQLPKTGAVVEHVYQQQGVYTARVTVTAGDEQATAEVTITVGGGGLPPPPGGPSDNDADAFEGFGATTPGGAGGRIIARHAGDRGRRCATPSPPPATDTRSSGSIPSSRSRSAARCLASPAASSRSRATARRCSSRTADSPT